jgi:iron complex transport system permease protein
MNMQSPNPAFFSNKNSRVLGVLLMLCAALFLLHLAIGAKALSIGEIWLAISAFNSNNFDHMIVWNIRLPRALIAITVGASLAVAGAIMQGVTKNPLASPSILGLLSGAAFAIVVALGWFGIDSPLYTPWIAALGASGAAIMVALIAHAAPGGLTAHNLTLAGAAVSAFLAAIITLFQLSNEDDFDDLREWLSGSLAGNNLEVLSSIAPWICLSLLAALLLANKITLLAMGDETAKSLGVKTARLKLQLMLCVIMLTACSVALVGPVGFIGLVIPHVSRFFVGADYRWVIPVSALLGACFLLLVDTLARVVISPAEISTGIATAIIGAPIFVYLIKVKLD